MKFLLVGLVRLYQILHLPFFGGSCRHIPTCSEYSILAMKIHGPYRGSWLTLKRLLRCHPFVKGGFDPVPDPIKSDGTE